MEVLEFARKILEIIDTPAYIYISYLRSVQRIQLEQALSMQARSSESNVDKLCEISRIGRGERDGSDFKQLVLLVDRGRSIREDCEDLRQV